MVTHNFDIQELVQKSGVPRRTIYFYVQQGILPPPQGAGLAAYYTDEHLLRLQLIPILRRQGLRLDDIRQRFEQMEPDEMQNMLAADSAHAQARERTAAKVIEARPTQRYAIRRFVHFAFPADIEVIVPAELDPEDQARVNRLIDAAVKIFSGQPVPDRLNPNGKEQSDDQKAEEDDHA